jgi:hypothetical protein
VCATHSPSIVHTVFLTILPWLLVLVLAAIIVWQFIDKHREPDRAQVAGTARRYGSPPPDDVIYGHDGCARHERCTRRVSNPLGARSWQWDGPKEGKYQDASGTRMNGAHGPAEPSTRGAMSGAAEPGGRGREPHRTRQTAVRYGSLLASCVVSAIVAGVVLAGGAALVAARWNNGAPNTGAPGNSQAGERTVGIARVGNSMGSSGTATGSVGYQQNP